MTRWVCSCSFITEGLKSFITLLLCYVTDGNSSRRNIKYSDINDQPEKKIQDILEIDQDHSSSRRKSSRVINDPTRCAAHRLRWIELFVNINQGWTIWETNQIAIFRTDTAIRFLISSLSSIFTVQKTENMWSKIWTDLYSHEKTNKRLLSFILVNRRQSKHTIITIIGSSGAEYKYCTICIFTCCCCCSAVNVWLASATARVRRREFRKTADTRD